MSAIEWKCNHAPSGCNYPEGECAGLCSTGQVPESHALNHGGAIGLEMRRLVGPESMFVAMDEARKRAEPVGVEKFTALMVGENHGLIGPFGSDFKGSPEHYQRITVYTHPAQPVQLVVMCEGEKDKQAIAGMLSQPVPPSTSAEDYLRGKYGAYRGHFAWRELEEAFNAGRQAQPVHSSFAEHRTHVDDAAQKLDKLLGQVINRRVMVEQKLFDMAAGKLPMPDADGLRKLAMELGDPAHNPQAQPVQPAGAINERLLKALKKAEDAMTWEIGGEPCGLEDALSNARAAIAAAEAEKAKGGV